MRYVDPSALPVWAAMAREWLDNQVTAKKLRPTQRDVVLERALKRGHAWWLRWQVAVLVDPQWRGGGWYRTRSLENTAVARTSEDLNIEVLEIVVALVKEGRDTVSAKEIALLCLGGVSYEWAVAFTDGSVRGVS